MKTIFILATLSFIVFSNCTSKSNRLDKWMVDVSEFTIQQDLLKDGDYVEILGASGNLTQEDSIHFYNLVVVRSEATGDTINVLMTSFLRTDPSKPRVRFISNSSVIGKMIESKPDQNALKGKNIRDLKAKSFNKVLYDSEYIQLDVRKYPAVTGTLGDFMIDGDLNGLDW